VGLNNVGPLGADYIALQKLATPRDHDFRRLILGERGLVTDGDPVLGEHFDEKRHPRTLTFDRRVCL
jgi:hypothetical protein